MLRLPDESLKIATKHLSGVGVISQCIARLSERAEQFKRTNKMRTNEQKKRLPNGVFFSETNDGRVRIYDDEPLDYPKLSCSVYPCLQDYYKGIQMAVERIIDAHFPSLFIDSVVWHFNVPTKTINEVIYNGFRPIAHLTPYK